MCYAGYWEEAEAVLHAVVQYEYPAEALDGPVEES